MEELASALKAHGADFDAAENRIRSVNFIYLATIYSSCY